MDRPYVLINMAMTADGKIATANRAVTSFGSARDLRHLHELRATADAILCGARTVNEPGITLGNGGARYTRLRARRGLAPSALRVVVSGRGRLRSDAEVFLDRSSPLVVLVGPGASIANRARLRSVGAEVRRFGRRELDLAAALRWLKKTRGVRRLLCEGGAELNDSLFLAGLVDELHLTLCPRIVGGHDAPTLAEGKGVARLVEATRLELRQVRRHADELFLRFQVGEGHPTHPRGGPIRG